MSGIQTNLIYDDKTTMQKLEQVSGRLATYDFLLNKFENRPVTNSVGTCDGKFVHIECEVCKDNEGTVPNTYSNYDKIIDRENDMSGRTRRLSGWDGDRFHPCYVNSYDEKCNSNDNKENGENKVNPCADNLVFTQPLLCDRSIVPTNMRQYVGPFTY